MKFERGLRRESLDASIARVASAYGFTAPPVAITKKSVADQGDAMDHNTAVTTALVKGQQPAKKPTQVWGTSKRSGGTTLSFTILASRHAISHALVIKTALSVAELAGYTDLLVAVSSIGDNESRRRFTRELGSYFKKNAAVLSPEILKRAATDPEGAYRDVLAEGTEAAERLPRPIDYLSENSRKAMVDTLHMFESVEIPYQLEPHLPATPGIHGELLFAVSGVDTKGERSIIATGGRLDELMKKQEKSPSGHSVGVSLMVPDTIEAVKPDDEQLSCFVVHVGEAAKLRAFTVLDALWRANIAVQEALMSESLRDQMESAKHANPKYIAIIGQRESLDKTILIRTLSTGMQQSVPIDKFASTIARSVR